MSMSQLQNEKSKVKSNIRRSRRKQNPTRLYKVVALNCVTVDDKKNPYFFLFSDIDTKDKYHLSRILKFFAFNKLSFFWYETTKGYHVLSPCLLTIEEWYKLRRGLKLIENGYYEGLNLRITPKNKEKRKVFFDSYAKEEYAESEDIYKMMKHTSTTLTIKTKLNISIYKEIEIQGVQY